MKKILISIFVFFIPFLLVLFSAPGDSYAQVSCPSSEMTCSTLDAQGGCEDPCIRVVTRQGGPAGRSGSSPARCACQLLATSEESLPPGTSDQDIPFFRLTDLEDKVFKDDILANFKFVGGSLGDVISGLLFLLFPLAGILLLFYLVIGGIQLMLSAGDPKAIEAAKGKITNALIGFLIIFVAYWLVQIIGRVLGIEAIRGIF